MNRLAGLIALSLGLIAAGLTLAALARSPAFSGHAPAGFWLGVLLAWLCAWAANVALSRTPATGRLATIRDAAVPVAFGIWLVLLWEIVVDGAGVSPALMPAPSTILARLGEAAPTLWADFRQTALKAALIGWLIGCASGIGAALVADRFPFLARGMAPLAGLASALPIIGLAPIMVMWFGFDWPSKAAVVVAMTFFPVFVNTVAGLAASGALERDLMRSYGAGWLRTLIMLRLPAALPFIFNALKLASTLALIGAIVAEFFGTPIVGMGFRIQTEAAKLSLDMVWAEIVVASVAGSAFYGALAALERRMTFWHPSVRMRTA
ncbi:ABC transporter permease [Hansschlegelia quercus]|uniref:ABC transporter permease n=1 Tax=Hansschlegelia quercus TaxID=2528245 RepID=A0A4Q9GLX6_9HYPH|nr:ABC transporter permease [Hansschlegelia quercus]TBN55272.1 ABC transporter permease [Hansschlegelia quercus]